MMVSEAWWSFGCKDRVSGALLRESTASGALPALELRPTDAFFLKVDGKQIDPAYGSSKTFSRSNAWNSAAGLFGPVRAPFIRVIKGRSHTISDVLW